MKIGIFIVTHIDKMKKGDIIKMIDKRINELKKMRSEVTTRGSKAKYNFSIGELMNLNLDIKENDKNNQTKKQK